MGDPTSRDPHALIIVDPSKAPDFDQPHDDDEYLKYDPGPEWLDAAYN
ncbi:MAG: hypothetical protein OXG47_03120 [bacterium]|nr:hypothetical protein [bacterium]